MSKLLAGIKYYFLTVFALSLFVTAYSNKKPDSDFSVKTDHVSVAGHEIIYDSIGSGKKNIVLLHGVFASKEQWTQFAEIVGKNSYRLIIPDLPGYGKSVGFPEKYYAIDEQVKLLDQFVTKLHLDKFSIAGNSMGGLIAAEYAKKYPGKVISLAFIGAPLGVRAPKKSEADKMLSAGKNPFIPLTEQEFNQEMRLLFTVPPKLSDAKIQKRVARYQKEKEKDLRIWALIEKYNHVFNAPFEISAPTLIMWGENDNIFNISGAKILKSNIKNSELIVIKNGSHLLFVENPVDTAKKYLNFLKNQEEHSSAN